MKKFSALVHYLIAQCSDNPSRLGAIRLNKALWYADVVAYQMNCSSITNGAYVKRQNGPVPKDILKTLRALEEAGKIAITEPEHQYDTRKFYAVVQPESNDLSDDEKALANAVLDAVCGYTANAISEMTHDHIWDAADDGEEIPLCATLVAEKGTISQAAWAWAKNQAESRCAA